MMDADENLTIHPTFWPDAALPGKVKVVIGSHEFWCHKEILWFASPFFQGVLQGRYDMDNLECEADDYSWAETEDPTSSVLESSRSPSPTDTDPVTIPVPDVLPPLSSAISPLSSGVVNDRDDDDMRTRRRVYPDVAEVEPNVAEILRELRDLPELSGDEDVIPTTAIQEQVVPRMSSTTSQRMRIRHSFSSAAGRDLGPARHAEAVVQLHEESASAFQDFLFWAYPQ